MDSYTLEWMKSHLDKLGGSILEIGSFDVNGGLRVVIPISLGVDMRKGEGVDLVCKVEDLFDHVKPGSFDSCVSVGTLEHCEDWKAFILNTWDAVKDGGYLVMTVASLNKKRHNYPNDYWRFTIEQLKEIYPSAEWVGSVGPVSYGWVVRKVGSPVLDVTPTAVE